MPLHDWNDARGWDSVHQPWLTYLVEHLQDHLPEGYRAYLGAMPALSIDGGNGRPDVRVHDWQPAPATTPSAVAVATLDPDVEVIARFHLDPHRAVHVSFHGRLVAAVEVVSPGNKDASDTKEGYAARYLGYLRQDVHLMLIDVLPRPLRFSFFDVMAGSIGVGLAATPAPFAASFRVGAAVPNGDGASPLIGVWRRPLAVGEPLPALPLPLGRRESVSIDLEGTYQRAAKRAYLD